MLILGGLFLSLLGMMAVGLGVAVPTLLGLILGMFVMLASIGAFAILLFI